MKKATVHHLSQAPENLALSVWIRMLKVHNLVFRAARTRMAPYCTMAQFDVIAQLSREKDWTTPAELSRRLLVTAGNLTGLLDRMQKSGLVLRQLLEKLIDGIQSQQGSSFAGPGGVEARAPSKSMKSKILNEVLK